MSETTPDTSDDSSCPERASIFDITPFQALPASDLIAAIAKAGVHRPEPPTRGQLLLALMRAHAQQNRDLLGGGILEILPDGFGFLRNPAKDFAPDVDDFYVSPSQIQHCALRNGDAVRGLLRAPRGTESNFALLKIHSIDGAQPNDGLGRYLFDELETDEPTRPLRFAKGAKALRDFDRKHELLRGQRIVLRGDDAALARNLGRSLVAAAAKLDDVYPIALSLDQRPARQPIERSLAPFAVVVDDTNPPEAQVRAARLCFERAKRLVERGSDVIVVIDSLDAHVRALQASSATTKAHAIAASKCLIAQARAIANGGSLTTIAITRGLELDALSECLDCNIEA